MDRAPESCTLCGSRSREPLIRKNSWQVYRCTGCGLGFLDPRPSKRDIKDLYRKKYFADHYGAELSPDRPEFKKRLGLEDHRLRFLRRFKRKGRILDIGCGNGYFLAACRNEGYEVQGVEISDWAGYYATQQLNLPVEFGDVEDMEFPPRSFDTITMWHFLEHCPDPRRVVSRVKAWLKRDGILVVDVPNYVGTDAIKKGGNWDGWDLPCHLYHFTPATLKRLIKTHGFKVIRSKTYHSETVKMSLKRIPITSLLARPIAKLYSGTSIAIIARLEL